MFTINERNPMGHIQIKLISAMFKFYFNTKKKRKTISKGDFQYTHYMDFLLGKLR